MTATAKTGMIQQVYKLFRFEFGVDHVSQSGDHNVDVDTRGWWGTCIRYKHDVGWIDMIIMAITC